MRKLFLLLLCILLLVSCRKPVGLDNSGFQESPVVNSILRNDSLLSLHLSLTGGIGTAKLKLVENASISISENDQFVGTMNYKSGGLYGSSISIEPDIDYGCSISIPGFEEIRVSEFLPNPVHLSNIVHVDKAGVDEEGISYPGVSFDIPNTSEETMYYEVIIKIIYYNDVNEISSANIIEITDPVILNEGLPFAIFSSEVMEDTVYRMNLNYTTGNSSGGETTLFPLVIELRTLSEDYYKYRKQLYFYNTGRFPDMFGSTPLPVSLYSNIEGAYGIFAGYTTYVSDTIYLGLK